MGSEAEIRSFVISTIYRTTSTYSYNLCFDFVAWLTANNGPRGALNCLSLQWMSSPTHLLPSSLYWQPQLCANVGGYICKKESQGEEEVELKYRKGTVQHFHVRPVFTHAYAIRSKHL